MNVTIMPVGTLGANCYILSSQEKNCAIIDPGAQPDKIAKAIKDAGLTPQMILLTHGHHDHIGAVNQLKGYFPDCKRYIGVRDVEYLTDPDKNRAIFHYKNPEEFRIDGAETLAEGDSLTMDELTIRVLETPGHTQGGLTYLCEDALFTGDTLFYQNCGRCDLYGGDYEMLKQSLKKLAELPGDYIVYPGHERTSSLEHERKNNHYMREACS